MYPPTDDHPKRLERLDASDASQLQRSWLHSSNRKLRHLQGISVRNLVINQPSSTRVRGKTIDDDNAPNALESPAKLLAKQESRAIHHSRSFTDLNRDQSPATLKFTGSENDKEQGKKDAQVNRRRSTLPWAGASPFIRQHRLESIAGDRMADTWFSLHCDGIEHPVYISEVVEKAMNPSFKYFDLNANGPLVSRMDQVTYKFWVRTGNMAEYILLLNLDVNLRSLQYIGQTLESFRHPLPANCVVFHFPDGVYTNLTDIPPVESYPAVSFSDDSIQCTSSYDALMRLANLDDCIQDALATREKLETQINSILEKNKAALQTLNQKSQADDKLSAVRRATILAKKQLRQTCSRKDEILASLAARKDAMAKGRLSQQKVQGYLSEAQSMMASSESLLKTTTEDTVGQIRRVCEDLLSIYPIEPIPEKPLAFTIRGMALPNSTFEDMDKECVAAALGYTAHLVYLLSFYLSVPLPYPVQPYLSHTFIQDPISVGLAQRTFPLYPVNTHYRFEYGVFLLNKNIEYLMNRTGLRVIDIRHTLPNLKYLLYVLTAGTGELPARQAGGVRGLLLGRMTPSLSRRGSEDSVMSGDIMGTRRVRENVSKANLNANGGGNVFGERQLAVGMGRGGKTTAVNR
ncbi:hypothetical protein FQN53_003309 [Emmonsiellopsis sp. PD_33]|nr:hypothetical protein FQN53_003309 [Emmonsiellopsis sp. PD_33]